MTRKLIGALAGMAGTGLLVVILFLAAVLLPKMSTAPTGGGSAPENDGQAVRYLQETLPPSSPLPTLTPSKTLKPPPTFEPPTKTPQPALSVTSTEPPTLNLDSVDIPDLQGLETPTPTSTPGCKPREDWKLVYKVQPNDAMEKIAKAYGITTWELAEGNCIEDPNILRVDQEILVPGEAHPATPQYVCTEYEVLTPMNGAYAVDRSNQITFNWRGPDSDRYLIRVWMPDGTVWEYVVDRTQNATLDLHSNFPQQGIYKWRVYPLGLDFLQIPCPESPEWWFSKAEVSESTKEPGGSAP
jgi:LysM repeat protein